jgi:orotidine-5'-phosphate decarboxylase
MIELSQHLQERKTRLCLGLDLDPTRIPEAYARKENPMLALALDIVEATADQLAAYKPNFAFFEQQGPKGFEALEKLTQAISSRAFVIGDAKRGDIGNTSLRYARHIFGRAACHAVTLAPYMGEDSIKPFMAEAKAHRRPNTLSPGIGAYVLALTSNPGAQDFQLLEVDGKPLYWRVLEAIQTWNQSWGEGRLGAVVGATRSQQLAEIREAFPSMPLLIPGVGAQGGDLPAVQAILKKGDGPALINVSRSVLYGNDALAEPDAIRSRAIEHAKAMEI